MAVEIRMPKLSDTMTEGSFIGWRKKVGDRIERGEVIAEVETDKAVMELEAFASGTLLKTMAQGGENVPVGTVLGLIGEPTELTDQPESPALPAESAQAPITPVQVAQRPATVQVTPPIPSEPAKRVVTPPVEPVPQPQPAQPLSSPPAPESENIKASPMVRHMALERGINLAEVHGSGPDGRILQEDLLALTGGQQQAPRPEPQPEPAPTKQPATAFTHPPAIQAAPEPAPAAAPAARGMRQAIAATVSRSWQEIPHFNVTVEIDMQACREVVRELKGGDKRVGYQSLVIKGCSLVLQEFPRLLVAAQEGVVNIGFAVALPDGLLVPVIRECQRRTPAEIEAEAVRLAERARGGHLTAEEMSGGGFTISNLGMYGVEHFNALIMPGQVGVLALGSVAERPVVRNGQLAAAVTMPVTLAADHRAVDGAYAAQFLKRLREILEQPLTLLV